MSAPYTVLKEWDEFQTILGDDHGLAFLARTAEVRVRSELFCDAEVVDKEGCMIEPVIDGVRRYDLLLIGFPDGPWVYAAFDAASGGWYVREEG